MCQLLGLSSSDPIRLTFNWETFAIRGSQGGGNPDGWGVAYFEGADVMLMREPEPAAESALVQFLATNAPRSDLIISHVRRATLGNRKLSNTQPFQRVLGGHTHVFAHNGFVPPRKLSNKSAWLRPQGDTDSEQIFCQLLGYLEPLWSNGNIPTFEERYDVVARFAQEIRQRGAANFLYSDGLNLFAHGHRRTLPGDDVSDEPGLYVSLYQAETATDMAAPCQGLQTEGRCSNQALVASSPLNDHKWSPLDAGQIACFQYGQRIR